MTIDISHPESKTLVNLDFGWNEITVRGARSLAKALRRNRTLKFLSLEENLSDARFHRILQNYLEYKDVSYSMNRTHVHPSNI
ncbi:unnamed protein product [Adineta ricciae]|uniref:Uncharacterized protein n=1 Tax=Adineta ricciae TaxID=249248 RepID=A0A816D435_ADIRI|nr:unnamed protein product [Adineta ricciae]CAF1630688.1 unnamed protein product [Adineta ricciae]